MIGISAPGWLMLVSLALLVLGALWQARRWLAGRAAPLDWLGPFRMPRRYLVDVHHVVARDRYAARMHMLAAGGFVAAVLLILLVHVFGIASEVLAGFLLTACALMAVGALMVAMRRWEGRTTQLSQGAFARLPYALFAFGFFFALASAPLAGFGRPIEWQEVGGFVLLVIGAWGCWELFGGMSIGPMRHALVGALHLAFHPRPARFAKGAREVALRPLRGRLPRLRRRAAAQSEEADPGSRQRARPGNRLPLCRQSPPRPADRSGARRACAGARRQRRHDPSGHAVVLHHLPRLRL